MSDWKPGDVANGHVSGDDNVWRPVNDADTLRAASPPPPPPPLPPTYAPPIPTAANALAPGAPSSGFSIASLVLGGLAFVIFPPLFGIAGLIVGAVALSRHERLAIVALVVSALGLVCGMIIGALVWAL